MPCVVLGGRDRVVDSVVLGARCVGGVSSPKQGVAHRGLHRAQLLLVIGKWGLSAAESQSGQCILHTLRARFDAKGVMRRVMTEWSKGRSFFDRL